MTNLKRIRRKPLCIYCMSSTDVEVNLQGSKLTAFSLWASWVYFGFYLGTFPFMYLIIPCIAYTFNMFSSEVFKCAHCRMPIPNIDHNSPRGKMILEVHKKYYGRGAVVLSDYCEDMIPTEEEVEDELYYTKE